MAQPSHDMGGHKALVKNKTPAPIQITAEQLLREAIERQVDDAKPPAQRIVDQAELTEYRIRKRKEFEDTLRRQRHHIGTWIKYALWEAGQKDFRRARSIFERALNVEYQNVGIWQKYIEMETKNKFINSARNLYDRVCQLLPRVSQFWFKYAHMEELLGNYAGARSVYERWMDWEPGDKAWMTYINFEERCGEIGRCRSIFERFLSVLPSQITFIRFSKFEERNRNITRARAGYEKAIELLPEDMLDEDFYIKFAKFEQRQNEMERAKIICKEGLKRLSKKDSEHLYRHFISFQKQHCERDELEQTILDKRRFLYEDKLKEDACVYDVWFDYIRLEESTNDIPRTREVYERAVANIPPISEKVYWKRYIFLWIKYAFFEELTASDVERCRTIYKQAIEIVPHKQFSFVKLWKLYAEFEIRQLQLDRARKIFGRALAECGKESIFHAYASLELRLGNIDRCRKIFSKFAETFPFNPKAWLSLVDLELKTEEYDRARAICEIAVGMEQMDMPELIWKCYIDLEVKADEYERARVLYERLLEKTQHFKVFKSYAEFEFRSAGNIDNARNILKRGLQICADSDLSEERALLLEHWLLLEREHGDVKAIEEIFRRQPKKVKKRRQVVEEDGESTWEEYIAYIFPDDGNQTVNLQILEAAKKWKKQMINNTEKASAL